MTGELATMGKDGDTKIHWTHGNADETAEARRTFDNLRAKHACSEVDARDR